MATAVIDQAMPRDMKLERVLKNDPDGKSVFALCSTANGESKAIVILDKKPWSEADIRSVVEGADTKLTEFHRNDKFSKYHGRPPPPMNEVSVTMICPANEQDIDKYTTQKRFAVRETPALYASATRPFVDTIPAKQLMWVEAIIDRKAEMDHLVYEDDGVMMVKGVEARQPLQTIASPPPTHLSPVWPQIPSGISRTRRPSTRSPSSRTAPSAPCVTSAATTCRCSCSCAPADSPSYASATA